MNAKPDTVTVAKLIGDSSRVAMLNALFYAEALPASALAKCARISPQTASSHLSKLCLGGVLRMERHGRHRYYHLASPEVAHILEGLLLFTEHEMLENEEALEPMYQARTCYKHLAGKLGVTLTQALQDKKWIVPESKDRTYKLSPEGTTALTDLGIDIPQLKKQRRKFASQCLDWTERHYHLSGALGDSLTQYLFDKKWIFKPQTGRVVHISNEGVQGFREAFGIRL